MIDTARSGFAPDEVTELSAIMHRLEAAQAAISAAEAARVRALADAYALAWHTASDQPVAVAAHDMALRGVAAEVAGCLRVSDRWAQRQLMDAAELAADYPSTLDAWEAGALSRSHVRVITELGTALPAQKRAVFENVAIPVCEHETPNRARGRLQHIVERLHPRSFTERHQEARETRSVRVMDVGDGMSELIATLPTVLAHAVYDRLTAQARTIDDARKAARAADAAAATDASARSETMSDTYERLIPSDVLATDERTTDQIRADVLADLLLTAAPDADPTRSDDGPGALGAIRAKVQITVPALTALGADEGHADLVGHAPVDAGTARRLLGTTTHPLERLITSPVTGSVIEVDAYQRPASLDRFLRARDQHCRFPGCRLAAVRCEVDHTHEWSLGGRTHRANLAHLCQRHHSMKQFTAWRVRQLANGILQWTSPLGRVYTDIPEPPVTFTPDEAPEPGDEREPCAEQESTEQESTEHSRTRDRTHSRADA